MDVEHQWFVGLILSVCSSKDTGRHLRLWEWKNEILARVEKKNPALEVSGTLCAPARPARRELNVCGGCRWARLLRPDSSSVSGGKGVKSKVFSLKPSLYGLIWLLALPVLLQRGQCEDRAGGWHGGGRRWRWGRRGGRGGRRLLWSTVSSSCGGRAAPHAARGGGGSVAPGSSSGRRRLPSGILLGLLPHQLPLPPAPLPPQVSVPRGGGRGGWGRLVLLGFPAGISEAGQRGTKPHPAASWALYSFLQLWEERKRLKHTLEATHEAKNRVQVTMVD